MIHFNRTLYLIFFIVFSVSIYAAPPLETYQLSNSETGFTIVYPQEQAYISGTTFNLTFDVLNNTYFRLPNTSVKCVYVIADTYGNIVKGDKLAYNPTLRYYYVTMTPGIYRNNTELDYYVHCNNTKGAGFFSGKFLINHNGKINDGDKSGAQLVVFLFVAIINLFIFVLNYKTPSWHKHEVVNLLIKRGLYIIALALAMNTTVMVTTLANDAGLPVQSELFGFYLFFISMALNIGLIVLVVWSIIDIAEAYTTKKRARYD